MNDRNNSQKDFSCFNAKEDFFSIGLYQKDSLDWPVYTKLSYSDQAFILIIFVLLNVAIVQILTRGTGHILTT